MPLQSSQGFCRQGMAVHTAEQIGCQTRVTGVWCVRPYGQWTGLAQTTLREARASKGIPAGPCPPHPYPCTPPRAPLLHPPRAPLLPPPAPHSCPPPAPRSCPPPLPSSLLTSPVAGPRLSASSCSCVASSALRPTSSGSCASSWQVADTCSIWTMEDGGLGAWFRV